MTSGFFISIEGGDGSGKSTQVKLLANWIAGVWPGKVTQTREPGGTEGAELIRNLVVSGDDSRWDSVSETLLMTAGRRDNLMKIIKPALDDGEVVITDRFYDSTYVYQGFVGGVDKVIIDTLNQACLDGIVPDVTILLDIDPAIGLARSQRDDNTETRFEKKGPAYHENVRQGFLNHAAEEGDRFIVINADQNEMIIHEEITGHLAPLLDAKK
jgi:dTMP kinase